MTPLQIKNYLWKNGLTISDLARAIEPEYDATFHSLRIMLTEMFYSDRYNSKLAVIVEEKFGIKVDPPRRMVARTSILRAA
jgi:hypothetical protein